MKTLINRASLDDIMDLGFPEFEEDEEEDEENE